MWLHFRLQQCPPSPPEFASKLQWLACINLVYVLLVLFDDFRLHSKSVRKLDCPHQGSLELGSTRWQLTVSKNFDL